MKRIIYLCMIYLAIIGIMTALFYNMKGKGTAFEYGQESLYLERILEDDIRKEQAFYVDNTYSGTAKCIQSPEFNLEKGTYTINIEYETVGGVNPMLFQQGKEHGMICPAICFLYQKRSI